MWNVSIATPRSNAGSSLDEPAARRTQRGPGAGTEPMSLHFLATSHGRGGGAASRAGSCARRSHRFAPQSIDALEDRLLLSALPWSQSGGVAAPAESSRAAELDAGARYRQELNVPFPTVDGGSELLNVYMPVGDPPAGGAACAGCNSRRRLAPAG